MKFWQSPNFLPIFFLLFFSLFALKDLAKSGFYTSHDGETHVARVAQYYQAIADGQIPPRWAKTLNGGLGSPIFVYIYPLPYLFGSAIHFFGFSFTDSFEILMALTFIFSGIFTYFWLKEVFNSNNAAFAGAIFYTWVPYRFSLIYVRGSISEASAYTFIPALFWMLTKLAKRMNLKTAAIASISFSAVLLSQNLVTYIVLPTVTLYVVMLGILNKSLKLYLTVLAVATWGLLISSVTYLSVIFERNLIHFDELFKRVYSTHFVSLTQLIHSPWGYGFSLPGENDSLSFQIGLAHILIVVVATVCIALILLQKKVFNIKRKEKSQLILATFFLTIFLVSSFLTLENNLVHTIWKNLKPLQLIDIPWRLLGLGVISTAFLAAFIVNITRSRILFVTLTAAAIIANRNHLRINEPKLYSDEFFLTYQGSATQYNEFTPRTRNSTGVKNDFPSRVESVKGNIKIYDLTQKSTLVSFKTKSGAPSRIQVNLVNFNGWQVFMDDQKFVNNNIIVDKSFQFIYRPKTDTSGLYDLIVPPGNHNFVFKYTETPLRTTANTASVLAFTLAIIIITKKQNATV